MQNYAQCFRLSGNVKFVNARSKLVRKSVYIIVLISGGASFC